MQLQSEQLITEEEELFKLFLQMEKKCLDIEDYKDPGMSNQEIIEKLLFIQKCIQNLNIFSENQKITDVHTEHLKYLALPYHIGYLFGKISKPRKQSVLQSKSYLTAFLNLCALFNCQDEQIFPKNAFKTWKNLSNSEIYKPSRDELVTNLKQKKVIQQRYQNNSKIKDPTEQRQSIKDFISLQIYESITQLKSMHEQLQILKYKDSIQKNQEAKEKHQEQLSKPVPKMKVWNIKKPQEINQQFLSKLPPCNHQMAKKQQLLAQVWQQNANKPTMTLQQVGKLQEDNMIQRMQRQKKHAEQNKQDTDSDKQQVDDRQKKKARKWDDWKDDHQKGAGNRNKGMR